MTSESATGRIEALLAEASWLEGLARALVNDRDEARDLVQDVWVAATERAPARIDRPRAWLAEVLRNALRTRRRSAAPRELRERARARDAAVAGTADVVERAEAQRLLVEHVLALEEPWRSTVLLRFFDGLSSEEIARRTSVPASTVRNRLAHALELLRARLARSRGTEWMAAVAPLAPGRAARVAAAAAPAVAVLSSLTLGKITLGAAAIAAVWLAAIGLRARTGSPPPPETAISPAIPTLSADERVAVASPERRESAATTSEPAPAPPPRAPARPRRVVEGQLPAGTLDVYVVDGDSPCPHAGRAELAPGWEPWYAREAPAESWSQAVGTEGRTRFEGLAAGSHGLRVSLAEHEPLCATADMPEDAGAFLVLKAGTARLHGTAWDSEGRAVPGARITMSLGETTVSTLTAEDGSYSLRGLARGHHVGVLDFPEGAENWEEIVFQVDLLDGEIERLDFGAPLPAPHWRGTLRTRTGAEHRGGATLYLRRQVPVEGGFAVGNPALLTLDVGSDGAFDLGLRPGIYSVEARLDQHDAITLDLGEVEVGEDGLERDLVLPGARLSGRVYDAETGRVHPGSSGGSLFVAVHLEGQNYPAANRNAWVDDQGVFAIDALDPGVYFLNAHPLVVDGGRDALRFEILPGQDELSLEVGVRPRPKERKK